MHLIKKIVDVEPFRLKLLFDDGTIGLVDLKNRLETWSSSEQSIFKELLIPERFKQVQLNEELATLVWPNGVDFCPDMLYEWAAK